MYKAIYLYFCQNQRNQNKIRFYSYFSQVLLGKNLTIHFTSRKLTNAEILNISVAICRNKLLIYSISIIEKMLLSFVLSSEMGILIRVCVHARVITCTLVTSTNCKLFHYRPVVSEHTQGPFRLKG